ncbi:hypothetical protein FP305_25400, partial [Escherichia coli]|nr:hypothetical protein [Escherichia coli]
MVTERYTKSLMGESNPPIKIMTSTKSCNDDLCLGTNHLRLQTFNMILIIKSLKNRKCLTCVPAPGGTGGFWHVGCLPLKYLTLPESGDF